MLSEEEAVLSLMLVAAEEEEQVSHPTRDCITAPDTSDNSDETWPFINRLRTYLTTTHIAHH